MPGKTPARTTPCQCGSRCEVESVGEPHLRLIVTGASGYIGMRLVELAVARGHEVVLLGSAPPGLQVAEVFPWRLGETPPPEALQGATAVVHLAHSWLSDSKAGS